MQRITIPVEAKEAKSGPTHSAEYSSSTRKSVTLLDLYKKQEKDLDLGLKLSYQITKQEEFLDQGLILSMMYYLYSRCSANPEASPAIPIIITLFFGVIVYCLIEHFVYDDIHGINKKKMKQIEKILVDFGREKNHIHLETWRDHVSVRHFLLEIKNQNAIIRELADETVKYVKLIHEFLPCDLSVAKLISEMADIVDLNKEYDKSELEEAFTDRDKKRVLPFWVRPATPGKKQLLVIENKTQVNPR